MGQIAMWWLVSCAVTIFVILQMRKTKQSLSMQLPAVQWLPLTPLPRSIRIIACLLHVASLFFLSWAFIHCAVGSGPLETSLWPSTFIPPPPPPADSRMLFFVIDRSGSMAEPMPDGSRRAKIEVVKTGTEQCAALIDQEGGAGDFFGLISFARAARIEVPLSRDRPFFQRSVQHIEPETIDRLNGTSIGYAIFKSVVLLAACRSFAGVATAKGEGESPVSNTILLITDGLEEPNPADRSHPFRSIRTMQALTYAKENNVTVHYINIDKRGYQQLSQNERDDLARAVEATGGNYFEIAVGQSLGQVMTQIAQSVGAKKAPPPIENRDGIAFWLILAAITTASLSRLLESVVLREVR